MAVMAIAQVTHGQLAETQWRLSLGVNYRDFGRVEAKRLTLSNPGLAGGYVNGQADFGGAGLTLVLDNRATVAGGQNTGLPANNTLALDRAAFGGDDTSLDQDLGRVIEGQMRLLSKSPVNLDLCLNLTTAGGDSRDRFRADVTTDNWREPAPVVGVAAARTPAVHPGTLPPLAPGGGVATTNGVAEYSIEVDAYTLGLGLKGAYVLGPVVLQLGLGPTLTLAELDARVDEVVRWNADGQVVYRRQASDDTTQVIVGGYLSLGLAYAITERWGVAAEFRYDALTRDLESTYADVSLDGPSGQLKLTYMF
jgi:hypothetical protein